MGNFKINTGRPNNQKMTSMSFYGNPELTIGTTKKPLAITVTMAFFSLADISQYSISFR